MRFGLQISHFFTQLLRAPMRQASRFSRDKHGVTSVEMALISIPFFGIMFAILEMSLMLFTNQALDTAVQDASRKIMTGQVQNGGVSQTQFKNSICEGVSALFDCSGSLYVDVKAYNSTAPIPTKPITASTFDPSSFTFNPGCPSQIVVVKAAFEYPVYATILGTGLQETSSGKFVLMSTVSFRNEPFVSSSC